MPRISKVTLLVLFLTLIGAGLFTYRAFVLGFPIKPNTQAESWHVEAKLTFENNNQPAQIDLYLPRDDGRYTIVDENFVSNTFGLTTARNEDTNNRIATWTKRAPNNKEIVYYRAILYEVSNSRAKSANRPKIEVPQVGSVLYNELERTQPHYLILGNIIRELKERSINDSSFVTELYNLLQTKDSRLTQLQEQEDSINSQAALASYILNHAGIPARVMNSVPLRDMGRNITPISHAHIFLNGTWQVFDKATRNIVTPTNSLNWWVGSTPLFTLTGGENPTATVSIKKHTESVLTESLWQSDSTRKSLYNVSIFSLPVDVQIVFSILLLVPIGSLVVCIMRQLIGIQTFGTFMPILVALSFRETQLFWGIILFSLIVGVGVIFRGYLNRIQLLLVPRLGAILTMVVLAIYALSLATYNMGLYAGLSVSLFPLVILAMLIERMSITWEEFGPSHAFKAALGSLIVAILGYLVMINEFISHIITTFPELLLIVLALHLMLGRYSGYKLFEYYRFRMLSKNFSE